MDYDGLIYMLSFLGQLDIGGYMKTVLDLPSFISQAGSLPLVGSELAFDLSNTSSGRGHSTHKDHLGVGKDVIVWAQHAKVLTPTDGEWAVSAVIDNRALADELLHRTLLLRETIYKLGEAIATGLGTSTETVDTLAHVHAACIARAHLVKHDSGFVWAWAPQDSLVEAILGPVTLSALTLLTQADLSRIKQCAGDHCGWLFFDTTKNKSRRWCEMQVCGNRAKQRRHLTRAREVD